MVTLGPGAEGHIFPAQRMAVQRGEHYWLVQDVPWASAMLGLWYATFHSPRGGCAGDPGSRHILDH